MLTDEEIDYELGIHDCGQNPFCNRYRSCGARDSKPLPSKEKLKDLVVLGTKKLLDEGFDEDFIKKYFKEKYEDSRGEEC